MRDEIRSGGAWHIVKLCMRNIGARGCVNVPSWSRDSQQPASNKYSFSAGSCPVARRWQKKNGPAAPLAADHCEPTGYQGTNENVPTRAACLRAARSVISRGDTDWGRGKVDRGRRPSRRVGSLLFLVLSTRYVRIYMMHGCSPVPLGCCTRTPYLLQTGDTARSLRVKSCDERVALSRSDDPTTTPARLRAAFMHRKATAGGLLTLPHMCPGALCSAQCTPCAEPANHPRDSAPSCCKVHPPLQGACEPAVD